MKGKYIAKYDVSDLAKKGDVVTLSTINGDSVEFKTANNKKYTMDKQTFFANFTPQTIRS